MLWCGSYLQSEGIWILRVYARENGISYVTSFKKGKKCACYWDVTDVVCGREVLDERKHIPNEHIC